MGPRPRRLAIGAVLAAALWVLAACSEGPADLPDDRAFAACLQEAGVDHEAAQDADARAAAFAEPPALDCVLALPEADQRAAVLEGVLDGGQARDAVRAWITDQADRRDGVDLAAGAGSLLGAVDGYDGQDDFGEQWADEQLHEDLALAILVAQDGEPASYRRWLEDGQAQQSVSASDPLAPASQYLAWITDPEHADVATSDRVRELRLAIDDARDATG